MDNPTRELTPDEIVAEIEAMKPRKRKVTIYQSWPRMILERERKRVATSPPKDFGEQPAAPGQKLPRSLQRKLDAINPPAATEERDDG